MTQSAVVVVRCDTYADECVLAAVEAAVEKIGGISRFARPGERIVLKPNVLVGTNPQKCVSTHPSVFSAVGRLLQHGGADVVYGDSPSFGNTEGHLKRAGLSRAADRLGISLADFTKGTNVSHGDALLIKSFVVANGVLESDGVVSLPKLKTHPLTRITGAIKNQFGCIPGLLKSQYHVKLPDPYDFATMLVDLNTLIRPRLYVMDAVMAMESQFYEGGCGGYEGLVPKDPAGQKTRRRQVRARFRTRFERVADLYRDKLIELYGREKGTQVSCAEAFEVCEYGRRPSPAELRRLFPFFPPR